MKFLILIFVSCPLLIVKASNNDTFASFVGSKSLPISFNGSQKLLYLVIKNCGLTRLDGEKFKDLTELKELNTTKNNLGVLTGEEFNQLETLEVLNLKHNRISEIPPNEFASLRLLRTLYLDENSLTSIDKMTFAKNYQLELLSMRVNDIAKLHYKVFSTLSKLRAVDLSLNRLTSVQADLFVHNVNLERIDLNRNNLQYVESTIFLALTKLMIADLEENPCLDGGFIWSTDIPKLNETINTNCVVDDATRVEWLRDEVEELKNQMNEMNSHALVTALPVVPTTLQQNIPSTTTEIATKECSTSNEVLEKKVSSLEEELTELKSQNKTTEGEGKAKDISSGDDNESCQAKLEQLQLVMNDCEEKRPTQEDKEG